MIHREDRDAVAVLRIEHGKANAIDLELFEELGRRLDELERSPARALVLTGTGTVFSAGVELFRVVAEGEAYLTRFLPELSATVRRFFALSLPVVAAVNGHAIAGGCVLTCAADRRLMAEGSGKVGLSELRVGVPFPVAAIEVVRAVVPPHRLQGLVYEGRLLTPGEAVGAGLIDEVVPPAELLDRACAVAAQLAEIPRDSFALTKRHLRQETLDRIDREAPRLDPEVQRIWSRPETLATIRAFLDRTVGRK